MEYEILRDVLIIVVSVIAVVSAVIGGIIFFLLRSSLTRDVATEVNKRVDIECRKLRAISDIQLGVTYWIQNSYDRAIEVTQRALEDAEDILDETKVIFAKSNLGYYYAEKHKQEPIWHIKEEAMKLVKLGYEKYSPVIDDRFQQPDWIDNYVFVKAVFVQTSKERDDVVQFIDSLLPRKDLKSIKSCLGDSKKYVSELRLTS